MNLTNWLILFSSSAICPTNAQLDVGTGDCHCIKSWAGRNCDLRVHWDFPEACREPKFDLKFGNISNYEIGYSYNAAYGSPPSNPVDNGAIVLLTPGQHRTGYVVSKTVMILFVFKSNNDSFVFERISKEWRILTSMSHSKQAMELKMPNIFTFNW